MTTKSYSLVKGRRLRATKLDACGRPVYGERSVAVTKGFISIGLTSNITESDAISVTNASGEVCVNEPAESSISGYSVEAQFCEVDPELFSLLTGQEVYEDYAGNIIGLTVNTKLEVVNTVALELWSGVANTDACANPDAQGSFGYTLLPFLKGGVLGDLTFENGAVTFTITGAASRDGHGWGAGPYDVILNGAAPSALPKPLDPNDALLQILVDVAPPEPFVGARPLLDPTQEELTAIAGVATGLDVVFTPTPDDLAAPVYYEFGDGTWDYLDASALGATSHTYAAPGTYTVKASSNGKMVSTTVTVSAP